MKKYLAILTAFCLLVLAVFGCGGKEVSAEEYVQGMYKLLVNMDEEGAKKAGISSGDVKKYQETLKKSADESAKKLNESFKTQYGVTVDESLIAAWGAEYFNAIKRLSCTTSLWRDPSRALRLPITKNLKNITGRFCLSMLRF